MIRIIELKREMAQVSRAPLDQAVAQRILAIFVKTISRLRNTNDVIAFISDLMSPREITMLTKRLAIALLIEKAYSYNLIKDLLKVSQGTVATVHLRMKIGKKGYHRVLAELLRDEQIESFLKKIGDALISSLPESHKGAGLWRQVKRRHWKSKKDRSLVSSI